MPKTPSAEKRQFHDGTYSCQPPPVSAYFTRVCEGYFYSLCGLRGKRLTGYSPTSLACSVARVFAKFHPTTADFTYVRLLEDRKGIEKQTKIWDNVIVDRSNELMSWVNVCQRTIRRGVSTYVYVNNHYAGFAPATVEQFEKLWKTAG